jgi:hypothetical protein
MDSIIEAVALSKDYIEAPVVVVSHGSDNKASQIITISPGSGVKEKKHAHKPPRNVNLIHLYEVDILKSLLFDGGKVVSRLFNHPIVIKDTLHIMPIIMEYVHAHGFDSRFVHGNLVVCFANIDDPFLFIRKTLFPFLEIVSNNVSDAGAFCVSSSNRSGKSSIYVCWGELNKHFEYSAFAQYLVKTIPELNLHAMKMEYYPIPSRNITHLQSWSTSHFLPLFSAEKENDAVIREVFLQYLAIAKHLYKSPEEFLRHNSTVYRTTIMQSLSSISQRPIVNSLKGDIISKILDEYMTMMRKNYDALIDLLNETCFQWRESISKVIPKDVSTELKVEGYERKYFSLLNAYDTIFSCSLMNAFFFGFFPYCVSELLPVVNKL